MARSIFRKRSLARSVSRALRAIDDRTDWNGMVDPMTSSRRHTDVVWCQRCDDIIIGSNRRHTKMMTSHVVIRVMTSSPELMTSRDITRTYFDVTRTVFNTTRTKIRSWSGNNEILAWGHIPTSLGHFLVPFGQNAKTKLKRWNFVPIPISYVSDTARTFFSTGSDKIRKRTWIDEISRRFRFHTSRRV